MSDMDEQARCFERKEEILVRDLLAYWIKGIFKKRWDTEWKIIFNMWYNSK